VDLKSVDWRGVNHAVGWLALSLYAFTWLLDFDLSRVGESIFFLSFLLALTAGWGGNVRKKKVLILLFLFLCVQVGSFFYTQDLLSDSSSGQVKSARHFSKLFLCVAVAWWIRGSMTAAKYVVFIFSAGFILSFIVKFDYSYMVAALNGARVDFGYTNAQHTALYFGLLLILSIFWLLSMWKRERGALSLFIPGFLFVFSLAGVFSTQTRAVWLALVMLMFSVLTIKGCVLVKKTFQGGVASKEISIIAALIVSSIVIGSVFYPAVEKRLASESHVISAVSKGEVNDLPLTSIGIRIATWIYAADKIKERPILGWGANSRKALIQEGPFPDSIKQRFGHFHNSYIELLLAYGLVGFLCVSFVTFLLLKGAWRAAKRGDTYFGLGVLSAWAFFMVANFFESYVIFNSGIYYFVLVGGAGMSFYIFPSGEK